ncbi:unnamed protein product [Phytomonas sp. EM1]|nr:unnamed protein product [Phytomonas sp. EM1]|eukprot:CCW59697.1 unnamed protein product [Phytomonas sp. isolate EM1]
MSAQRLPLSSSSNVSSGNLSNDDRGASAGPLPYHHYGDNLYIYEAKLRSCAAQSSTSVQAARQQLFEVRRIRLEHRANDKKRRLWFSMIITVLLWMFMSDQANRYSAMFTHLQTQEYAKAYLPVKWVVVK